MSRYLVVLESFLALSETMAKAAEDQEWDELVRVGEERGTLVDNLPADFAAHLPLTEQTHARSMIERCQQLDTQTCAHVEERKKSLDTLLRGLSPLH